MDKCKTYIILTILRSPSGLMIQQKGSQDTEELYSQLRLSTVKGQRLEPANGKGSWGKIQKKTDVSFPVSPPSGVAWRFV